jgi:hypothetical protein
MLPELLSLSASGIMNSAAPTGHTRGGSVTKKFKKNSLPTVPRKDPDEEVHRRENNLGYSEVNRIDLCLFLE